ncbi:MAG: ribonuclease HI [Planctomycetia bacterium]|nr:ribonuclease HI [Planctomycetia bacterium]
MKKTSSGQASLDPEVRLFTDGACKGNPGPGGWGFLMRHVTSGKEISSSGGEPDTTNNRMELQAVIEGLSLLKRPTRVEVVSDSAYVLGGLESWMASWKRNGWQRREKGKLMPVKNVDLWQKLDELMSRHTLAFTKIKGHSGHPENETCDQLAVQAAEKFVNHHS